MLFVLLDITAEEHLTLNWLTHISPLVLPGGRRSCKGKMSFLPKKKRKTGDNVWGSLNLEGNIAPYKLEFLWTGLLFHLEIIVSLNHRIVPFPYHSQAFKSRWKCSAVAFTSPDSEMLGKGNPNHFLSLTGSTNFPSAKLYPKGKEKKSKDHETVVCRLLLGCCGDEGPLDPFTSYFLAIKGSLPAFEAQALGRVRRNQEPSRRERGLLQADFYWASSSYSL